MEPNQKCVLAKNIYYLFQIANYRAVLFWLKNEKQ